MPGSQAANLIIGICLGSLPVANKQQVWHSQCIAEPHCDIATNLGTKGTQPHAEHPCAHCMHYKLAHSLLNEPLRGPQSHAINAASPAHDTYTGCQGLEDICVHFCGGTAWFDSEGCSRLTTHLGTPAHSKRQYRT